jgi:undecaprenyl-diphosphatase
MTLASLRTLVRTEIVGLASLAAIAAGVLAFIGIADEVGEGETHAIDETILLSLREADRQDPIGPRWVEIMFTDLTSLGSTTILTIVTLAVLGYLLMVGKKGAALMVLCAVGGGTLLNSLLKLFFDRPRPDLVAHIVDVHTASFPSGHAMLSAITYLTLGALLARVQERRRVKIYILTLAVTITIMVGVSRVYLGVHWPTDVLAGWCAGASWAILCWIAALYLQRRGKVEEPGAEPGAAKA